MDVGYVDENTFQSLMAQAVEVGKNYRRSTEAETAENFSHFDRLSHQRTKSAFIDIPHIHRNVKLSSQFCAGALGYCQKPMELNRAASFKAFGQVRHARDCSTSNLIL